MALSDTFFVNLDSDSNEKQINQTSVLGDGINPLQSELVENGTLFDEPSSDIKEKTKLLKVAAEKNEHLTELIYSNFKGSF